MKIQSVTLGADQSVEILQVGGDMMVRGWDQQDVVSQGDGLQTDWGEGAVRIKSTGDLVVSMPRAATLKIGPVGGDTEVQDLNGAVSLSAIGGDVTLRNLQGAVSLNGPVGGDTRFANVLQVSVAGASGGRHSERQQRRFEARMRKAERKMERVGAKTGADVGRWLWRRRGGVPSGDEAGERVSDEERMAILKMLQEKKITSAEADRLLAALEGEDGAAQAGGSPPEAAGSERHGEL